MKVFVTGGTGFIGANLVRQLLDQGHEVVCLTRRTSPGLCLDGLDVTLIQADLSDPQAMRRALDGCQQIYHLAGIFDPSPGGRESMFEVHVNATRSLLQAGKAVGIDRLLLCSSSVTVGFGPKSDPGDENSPIDPGAIYGEDGPLRWYYESKLAAEALVRDFEGVDTVTVNPDFILGAWDIKPTSGQLVLSMMKGWVPVYPKGGKCFMDADDCALGHIGAMERGRSGERYLLGNENHSYRDFMAMISQVTGRRGPLFALPRRSAEVLGAVGALGSRFDAHRFAGLDRNVLRSVGQERYRSAAKANAAFRLPRTPLELSIEKAARWFTDHGYLD